MKTLVNRAAIACVILCTALLLIGATNFSGSTAAIAVVSKVVQEVSKKVAAGDWTKAKKGDALSSGDEVRTGDKSIAVVKFKDNSILRVREKAELRIQGEVVGSTLAKSVHINRGVVGFEVTRQENEKFTFTSPTSVASIRGTKGALETESTGDNLIVTAGLVNLLNLKSNRDVNVAAGETGISQPDGTVNKRPSTPQERDRAVNALRAGDDTRQNELKIELRDPRGNTRDLKIRYRE